MFKLDGTRTTTALTTMLVNRRVVVRGKRHLLGSSILGNAIIVVLFAYMVDSLMARHSTHHFTVGRRLRSRRRNTGGDARRVLVPITGPSAVRSLVGLTLIVGSTGRGGNLVTLGIVGSDGDSRGGRLRKGQGLRGTTVVTTTTSIPMGVIDHCSLGVTSKVVRAVGRCRTASMMVNLRQGTGVISAFFKGLTRDLLGNARHRIVVTGFLVPIGALHQVGVTMPPGTRCRAKFSG